MLREGGNNMNELLFEKKIGITFTQFYNEYFKKSINWLLRHFIGVSEFDAEDIVIRSFLVVLDNIEIYDPNITKINTYLISIVKRNSIDFVRRDKWFNYKKDIPENFDFYIDEDNSIKENKEKLKIILKIIETLPNHRMEAFELLITTQLTYQEIADKLGYTRDKVNNDIKYIREKIKKVGKALFENNI